MELKDAAVALAGISVVMLALGFFTKGVAFYAALGIVLAVEAIDFCLYLLLIRDLKRNLTSTRSFSGRELLMGSAVTITYELDYGGKRNVPVLCAQPGSPGTSVEGSPLAFNLSPGRQTVLFTLRPSRRGSHAVKGLQMVVESYLFRGSMIAGSESEINTYVAMGHDRAGYGARRGRLQRLSLPGSEALRPGAGSDFSCIRDFMPGDSTRNIDWARSSRSHTLVVRSYEDERTLPLAILIDVDPSMEAGAAKTELESAVELATVLASKVLLDNERVGLACFSRSDVTSFQSPAGGKGQMAHIRAILSAVKAVEGDPSARAGFPTLQEAEAIRLVFRNAAEGSAISPIMDETIRQFSANVREDGFIKAIALASRSTGTPCSIIVITNLSMGVASLLNGIRIATYYGHNVSVALTPHIWYDGGSEADPEKCFNRYRQAKDMISRLRGRNITVVELSACEKPETVLYTGRVHERAGTLRRRR